MNSTRPNETFEHVTSFPEGARCWIISDGKAGNETQCLGVAAALGLTADIKRVAPTGLGRLLAPYGPVQRRERFGCEGTQFAPPWPEIAIACGRLTTPYIRALRRRSKLKTYTVILLDPKTGPNSADLFWVPQHDRRRGANVLTSLTSPHRFSPQRLVELRANAPDDITRLPHPRIAMLIGGPSSEFRYGDDDIAGLAGLIAEIARLPVGLMVTCSRRTPPALATAVEQASQGAARVFWTGEGDNPYPAFLANADAFFVTADSVNMVGEACTTGRPVHVFYPQGGSAKFGRFHASLAAHGATRPIRTGEQILDTWSYEPLFSATAIAEEIKRRYLRRRALLGNLM